MTATITANATQARNLIRTVLNCSLSTTNRLSHSESKPRAIACWYVCHPVLIVLTSDPAGFPPDWQASVDAKAVDVVAGSYTPVLVPLILSYTISGVLTDTQGNPINGARVEAVSTSSGQRLFSVTNGAGVYYLERLQQAAYTLQINGKPAQSGTITIDKTSAAFQELNLQQP